MADRPEELDANGLPSRATDWFDGTRARAVLARMRFDRPRIMEDGSVRMEPTAPCTCEPADRRGPPEGVCGNCGGALLKGWVPNG